MSELSFLHTQTHTCPLCTLCYNSFVFYSFRCCFFFSSILIKRCLLCCQGRFSRGGRRGGGRQRRWPRQEVVIRESKAIIKRGPRASGGQNTVVRGKREIGLGKNYVKWRNKTWALGEKSNVQERRGKGFGQSTDSRLKQRMRHVQHMDMKAWTLSLLSCLLTEPEQRGRMNA